MKKFENYEEEKKYFEHEVPEEEFIKWYQESDLKNYEKPSVTIDTVIFQYDKELNKLQLMLLKRGTNPFKSFWKIPGSFANKEKDLNQACLEQIYGQTDIKVKPEEIEQLYTFSRPNRDPRTWVISVGYLVFLPKLSKITMDHGEYKLDWFDVECDKDENIYLTRNVKEKIVMNKKGEYLKDTTVKLAFDHNEIISTAIKRIRNKLDYEPIVLNVLGSGFTLPEARKVYAKFLGIDYKLIDNSNFKKTHEHLFKEIGMTAETKVGRPAKIYRIKNK